jgi:AcrR family transcriptional regulator
MTGGADKREPARPSGLSRERILEVASAVVEADGLEAVSMRRLAQALDVWPMALYRYFADKDELLDALVARATDEVTRPAARGPWRERLAALLGSAREALGGEGLGLGARLPRALVTPGVARLARDGLGILADAGFEPEAGARAWRVLLSYTVGFAAVGGGEGEEFAYGLERLLDGLESELRSEAVRSAP